MFGNPSLFQEFEKTRDPSDTILLNSLDNEFPEERETISVNGIDSDESDGHETGVAIVIGSSDGDAEDSSTSGQGVEIVQCKSETVRNGNGMEHSRSKRVPKKSQHGSNTSTTCSETSNSNRILKEQIDVLKRENILFLFDVVFYSTFISILISHIQLGLLCPCLIRVTVTRYGFARLPLIFVGTTKIFRDCL